MVFCHNHSVSNYQFLKDFVEVIDADQQASLLCSNFHGFIYGMIYRAEDKQQFSSKLVHEFILRLVHCGKNNEIWVKFNDKLARFGLQEFCLITGLPCQQISLPLNCNNSRLRNQYFNGTKKITMAMLFQVFHVCDDREDKFKLRLVMFVECMLKPRGRTIDYKTLSMVEDVNSFIRYPWGRVAYFVLLHSLQQTQVERLHRLQQSHEEECKYALHGYPLAFQYWIYEAFPRIGEKFGHRRYKTPQVPRMHRWKPKKFLTEKRVKKFLATKKIEVIPILEPNDEELYQPWYTSLVLPHDNEHSVLDSIVRREISNHLQQETVSDTHPIAYTLVGVGSSYSSTYVTKEEIEHMFNIHRQHGREDMEEMLNIHRQHVREDTKKMLNIHGERVASDVSKLWKTFTTETTNHYQELFQQQQHSQQQNSQQNLQSSMENYFNYSFTSLKSYIHEENSIILNKLSESQSNIQGAIASLHQDVCLHKTSTSQHAEKATATKLQFRKSFPLENYSMLRYKEIEDWISKNPPSEYWPAGVNKFYRRDELEIIIDTTKEMSIKHLEDELTVLRECSLVSKEYAILDFRFYEECIEHFAGKKHIKEGVRKKDQHFLDFNVFDEYVLGNVPTAGRPWLHCNSLLIPSSYGSNEWFLFHINFREWKFRIYDCSHATHMPQEIFKLANPVIDVVRYLLLFSSYFVGTDIQKNRNKKMELQIMPSLQCANSGPNSAIFLLKYIECLVLGYAVESISSERMEIYRRKIAVDLCCNKYFV